MDRGLTIHTRQHPDFHGATDNGQASLSACRKRFSAQRLQPPMVKADSMD